MKLPTVDKIEYRSDNLYIKCDLIKGNIKFPQPKTASTELGKTLQLDRLLCRFFICEVLEK